MPLYEYKCVQNGHRFEVRQGYNDTPVTLCPECGGVVRRVVQPVGIAFKGSGFYATDSRKSGSSTKSAEKPAADTKTEGKSDSGTTEKKPETKAETKSGATSDGATSSKAESPST